MASDYKAVLQRDCALRPVKARAMLECKGYDSKDMFERYSLGKIDPSGIRFSICSIDGKITERMEINLQIRNSPLRLMDRSPTRKLVLDGDVLQLVTQCGVFEVSTQIGKRNADNLAFDLAGLTEEILGSKAAQTEKTGGGLQLVQSEATD